MFGGIRVQFDCWVKNSKFLALNFDAKIIFVCFFNFFYVWGGLGFNLNFVMKISEFYGDKKKISANFFESEF